MGRMSREKGKRTERWWAALFRHFGFHARRRQQYSGTDGTDDISVQEIPWLHLESKGEKTARIQRWLAEAHERQNRSHLRAILWRPGNPKDAVVIMEAAEFVYMLKALVRGESVGISRRDEWRPAMRINLRTKEE